MTFHRAKDVRVVMPQAALAAIFSECDGFDRDETGGRLIGTFVEHKGKLTVRVGGVIDSGPQAKRSSVSFFQDGEHQERIFRQVERDHPEIEHLGNWHTHHVNGFPTLSGGDIATYQRTVNHPKHNIPFFYAVLVTAKHGGKDPLRRYSVKHYIFRRGDDRAYEIAPQMVELVKAPLVWPLHGVEPAPFNEPGHGNTSPAAAAETSARPERAFDGNILREFYGGLRTFSSPQIGVYWRGPVDLCDGSKVQVVVMEDATQRTLSYSITLRQPPDALRAVAEQLEKRQFPSARAALILTERACNHALFQGHSAQRATFSR